ATRSESFRTRQAGRRSEEFCVGEAFASLPCFLFRVVELGYNWRGNFCAFIVSSVKCDWLS
ncbi:unnamed protein product, partial [Musa textilis]